MKNPRIISLIILSALGIMLLIFFQLRWIQLDRDLRNDQFNQRVSMALCDAVGEIAEDVSSCLAPKSCMEVHQKGDIFEQRLCQKIDADMLNDMLKISLTKYNIPLPYTYQIFQEPQDLINNYYSINQSVYGALFDKSPTSCDIPAMGNNWRLELYFPGKENFLFGQMRLFMFAAFVVVAFISLCLIATIRMAWRQQQISERNRNFIDNMAHEMKTPLTNISLAARLLKRKGHASSVEKSKEFIHVIQYESEQLNDKIEHVLQMASMEQGKHAFHFEYFDIPDMLQAAIERIRLQVENRGGEIALNIKLQHARMLGDVQKLQQAMINLLDNANKYSPNIPHIQLDVYDSHEGVHITCIDHGKGISRSQIQNIFEKFHRISDGDIHNTKGFGIGLAFVKQVIEAHKGRIRVLSEVGKGSRFEIFLPNY